MILQGHIATSGRKRGKFVPLMTVESLSHLSRIQKAIVDQMKFGLQPCNCIILNNKDADDYRRNCRASLKWIRWERASVIGDGKSFVLPVHSEISPRPKPKLDERQQGVRLCLEQQVRQKAGPHQTETETQRKTNLMFAQVETLLVADILKVKDVLDPVVENVELTYLRQDWDENARKKKESVRSSKTQRAEWDQFTHFARKLDPNRGTYISRGCRLIKFHEHICRLSHNDMPCTCAMEAGKDDQGQNVWITELQDVDIIAARWGCRQQYWHDVYEQVTLNVEKRQPWQPTWNILGDPIPGVHKMLHVLIKPKKIQLRYFEKERMNNSLHSRNQVYSPSFLLNEVRVARSFMEQDVKCPECESVDWGVGGGSSGGAWSDVVCKECMRRGTPTYVEVKTKNLQGILSSGPQCRVDGGSYVNSSFLVLFCSASMLQVIYS